MLDTIFLHYDNIFLNKVLYLVWIPFIFNGKLDSITAYFLFLDHLMIDCSINKT